MKVSYKWINGFLGGKAPKPEKMAELLTMNSMEVEGLEKVGDDFTMDIKTLPNNNHSCLCHRGIAREVSVLAGIKVSRNSRDLKDFTVGKTEKNLSVKIEDEKLCRRYAGRIIENIKVGPSPKWLKESLEVLGQRSINNIVDATNFVMLEIGQPMHAFDADKLVKGNEIIISVQNAKNGDRIMTLDKKDVELDESVLLITDGKNPLAVAGVKGGIFAELDEKTKNIVLESANFNPTLIRKTAQKLKIQTDASKRYENDYSPEMVGEAMDILTKIIVEVASMKDTKVGEVIDNYPRKANKYKLGISAEEASSIIGIKIGDKEISDIFDRFGFEYKKVKPIDEVSKLAPTFVGVPYKKGASISYDAPKHFDCSGFVSYLFAQAGVQIPRISVDQFVFGGKIDESDIRSGDIVFSNTGAGKIYQESQEFLPHTKVPEGVDHCGLYLGDGKITHATSSVGKVITEDLGKSTGFKNIVGYGRMAENKERFVITVPDERLDLRIKEDLAEEIGRVYGYGKIKDIKIPKAEKVPVISKAFNIKNEIRKILISEEFSEIINYTFTDNGEIEVANPMSPERRFLRTNLTDGIKNSLEFNARYSELVEMPQIRVFEFGHIFTAKGENENFVIGVKNPTGVKSPKEKEILESSVKILSEKLGLVMNKMIIPIVIPAKAGIQSSAKNLADENILECDFSEMISKITEPKTYDFSGIEDRGLKFKKISQYPFMIRDVAVFTPEGTSAEEVFKIISKEVGELAVKSRLFDVFTKKFPDGSAKTSYAYRIIFQSYERTLTDDEVNKIMEKVTSKLNSKKGWQVR
jgi:phenylalanyl-tRNA synthetase beta subunit